MNPERFLNNKYLSPFLKTLTTAEEIILVACGPGINPLIAFNIKSGYKRAAPLDILIAMINLMLLRLLPCQKITVSRRL